MSFFSLTFLAFLSFFFFLARIPFASCFHFTFSDFESESDIKFFGSIDVSGGPLQLTGGQHNAATAYYAHAIPMWCAATNENASFSTYFEFSVSFPGGDGGGGGGTAANSSPSGGFAFFLASVNSKPSDRLLAVEFNSFRTNSISNGTVLAANNDTLAARISYNATSKSLLVQFEDLIKVSPDSSSMNLSRSVDVRQVLPDKVLVGFAVNNGSAAVLQRITRWNFTSDLEPERNKFMLELWMVAPVVALILALLLVAPLTYYICRGRGSLRTKILYWAILSLEKGVTFARRRPLLCRRLLRSSKVEDSSLNLTESMDDEFSGGTGPRRFSYRELALATNNFSEKRKLGEGGFGGVYKGFLGRSGREVAVKRISSQSKQGRKEYSSEVKIISRLRHRNLVQLLGWCHERGEFLLVYEFLPNGSLDAHLFGRKTALLPWSIRYKVAAGLAKALLYLHEEWEQCVVHRDIKPSNVMLDSGFNAKLGDFGLARLVDHQLGQYATGVAGTLGYLAPECFRTGKTSKESDAYSFGIVALEIATGRRAVDPRKEAEDTVRLVEWVWEMNGKRRLMEAADRRLGSDFEVEEMERLMLVGLWCAHPDQGQRPSMREVIQALRFEGGTVMPSLPRTMPVPVFPLLPMSPASGPSAPPTVTFGSLTTGR